MTLALSGGARAACPERLAVGYGDTPASIASACGISVEALRQANPGMTAGSTLQGGTTVVIPRPALPSPRQEAGRSGIPITPSIVPPATGTASPTVLKAPKQRAPNVHDMLRDFDRSRPNAELFDMFRHQNN